MHAVCSSAGRVEWAIAAVAAVVVVLAIVMLVRRGDGRIEDPSRLLGM